MLKKRVLYYCKHIKTLESQNKIYKFTSVVLTLILSSTENKCIVKVEHFEYLVQIRLRNTEWAQLMFMYFNS